MGYEVAEIKSRIKASEEGMTKADAFEKATKLAMKGDLTLHEEILHPDYESMNQRVPINREMSKSILSENGPLLLLDQCKKSMKMKSWYVFIAFQELLIRMFSMKS